MSTTIRVIALMALTTLAIPVQAHFLWGQIVPSDRPIFRLVFAEAPTEPTAAGLLPRVKPVRLVSTGGKELTAQTATDAVWAPLASDAQTACAEQIWGVLNRSEQGRGTFLLHYHAKAAVHLTAAGVPQKRPVEILARRVGGNLEVEVRRDDYPVPEAKLTLYAGAATDEKTADIRGKVTFPMPTAPLVGIRAEVVDKTPGKQDGMEYELIRHYATLTFPLEDAASRKPDPVAWNLLKEAHDSRQTWPVAVTGLEAEVVLQDDGTTVTGKTTYSRDSGTKTEIRGASEDAKNWLDGQIANLLGHRRGGSFETGDGRHPITFTDDQNTSLGRQVALHDRMQSLYRVKDRVVTEVTRTAGDTTFTITVLEVDRSDTGKYLPRHFVVTYFNKNKGAIEKTESYTDTHAVVEGVYIPVYRRVITAENGKFVTRTVELRNIRLTQAAK